MALQITVTTAQGFDAVDAYHRIELIQLSHSGTSSFHVRSYKELGFPSFNSKEFSFDYDAKRGEPFVQAYEHLKTLPEFALATDC